MESEKEEVLIIGLDEQGIFLSLLFAKAHYHVVAFDVDNNKTKFLQKGYYDKRIYGLNDVFSLYKENIFFSSDVSVLKKNFHFIIINQLKKSEWELLDEISFEHSPYFILTEPSSIIINNVLYQFLKDHHKKAYVMNWPIIDNQRNTFLNVFFPTLLLIGCREDEEHLAMHFLMESLYLNSVETVYTDIDTTLKIPLFLDNYQQMLTTFFKDQLSEIIKKKENTMDLIYVLEKLGVMNESLLTKKAHSNQLTSSALLTYEKEIEEKVITTILNCIHQSGITKIGFLGIEPPFDIEKNYVLKLIKLLTLEMNEIWFYDEYHLNKTKECLKSVAKIHYAMKKEELFQMVSLVIIGSSQYDRQDIRSDFVFNLTNFSTKKSHR